MKENLNNIVTSTPFRLGIVFTLFFLACSSIEALVFYKNMQARIDSQIDQVLTERYNEISKVFTEYGIEGVTRMVRTTQSDQPGKFGMGYHLAEKNGKTLLGKLNGLQQQKGFSNASGQQVGLSGSKANFRLFRGELNAHDIVLGLNVDLRDELQQKFKSSFVLHLLMCSIATLIGATYLAKRYNQRFTNLANFMAGVGSDNLDRRLPVSQKGDGIDRLSGDINNALSLLQRQVAGMKQVSDNIAHDLKTPLNRLSFKIEEAISLTDVDDPILEKLEAASENVTQINNTFEQLLFIAQLEAGARRSKFVDTDLKPLLMKVFEVFQVMADEKNQQLHVNVDENQLLLLGDDDLLCQLIVSLLENSIRHCVPGSEIKLSGGLTDACPWFSVCDNGGGIPKDQAPLLFDPLYRIEKSRTTSGSGLGLTLAKAIADLHGGDIVIEDNTAEFCVKVTFQNSCSVY